MLFISILYCPIRENCHVLLWKKTYIDLQTTVKTCDKRMKQK